MQKPITIAENTLGQGAWNSWSVQSHKQRGLGTGERGGGDFMKSVLVPKGGVAWVMEKGEVVIL